MADEESLLETGAVFHRHSIRGLVALEAFVVELLVEDHAVEEHLLQPARDAAAVLRRESEETAHVLVDLGLQLELEQGHRTFALRVPGEIGEVGDALEENEVVADDGFNNAYFKSRRGS